MEEAKQKVLKTSPQDKSGVSKMAPSRRKRLLAQPIQKFLLKQN